MAKKKLASTSHPHVKKLQQDVDNVVKAIYHGNGKPSIVTQLTALDHKMQSLETTFESKIKNLEKEMELKFTHIAEVVTEKFNNISLQITQEFDKKKVDATGLWNFKTAVTTSVLAAITSIFVILISELVKRV